MSENQNTKPIEVKDEKYVVPDQVKEKLAAAVVEQTTSVLNPVEHEQLRKISKEYWQSGAFPESYKNADQIMMAMIMGKSMGMTPHESVVNGYFIRGVYNVYGKAIPAAIRRHGWSWKFIDENPEECSVLMTNKATSEEIYDTFTFADAMSSGFTKDNYGKDKIGWKAGANRKRKLRYGVLSQVLHTYIPEVLGAVTGIAEYTEDYMDSGANKEQDRKDRIEKAEAERMAMRDTEFTPTVIDPVLEEYETQERELAESAFDQEVDAQ